MESATPGRFVCGGRLVHTGGFRLNVDSMLWRKEARLSQVRLSALFDRVREVIRQGLVIVWAEVESEPRLATKFPAASLMTTVLFLGTPLGMMVGGMMNGAEIKPPCIL